MKILVAIKQVPDRDTRLVLDPSRTGIIDAELNWVINESDRYALETGLRLKEAAGSGEVVVVTIGPDRAHKGISSALAMGADRGVHLNAPEYQNSDPWVVSRILTALVKQEKADLVLCGTRSDDSGYGETPILLAGMLDWPCVFLTMGAEITDGKMKVIRELEAGRQEVSEITLPAVLAVQSGIYEVRYTSLKGIMAAKKKLIDHPMPHELGFSGHEVGPKANRLEILEMSPPEKTSHCEMLGGSPAEMVKNLVDKLRREAKVF